MDEEDVIEDDEVDELEDEFVEYPPDLIQQNQLNTRVIQTVPAKEPSLSAVPLKSALKKPRGSSPVVVQVAAAPQPVVNDRPSTSGSHPPPAPSASSNSREKSRCVHKSKQFRDFFLVYCDDPYTII